MTTAEAATPERVARSPLAAARRAMFALAAAAIGGALAGVSIGGVGGRIVMRIIFLFDDATEGALTDFGTVGEFTLSGTLTLLMLTTIAGGIGGLIYLGLRRWLPWRGWARGALFGFMMMYGPAIVIFNPDAVDLQIFEPILPFYYMFVALMIAYGVAASWLIDRLHAAPPARPGHRMETTVRGLLVLVLAAMVFAAVTMPFGLLEESGSCLSSDQEGGCAVPAPDA